MANPVLRDSGTSSPIGIYETYAGETVSTGIETRRDVTPHRLGTVASLDERTFIWAKSTGAAIGRGNLCAVAAPGAVGVYTSVAYASGGAAGTNTLTVTLGAGAVTANQYRDGWLYGIDGGGDQLRKIREHPAAAASATLQLTVWDPFEEAIAAGELSLTKNEYDDVVVHPGRAATTLNLIPVGVPCVDVPAGSTTAQYFWIQTGGPCLVVGDASAFTPGSAVIPASATADAGQVTAQVIAGTGTAVSVTDVVDPVVGYVITQNDASSDGDFRLIHLVLHT